jgi:hypothetical protein
VRKLIVATELGPPLVMVKVNVLELPPPGAGLVTVTPRIPVEAMLAAGMAAVNWVELTNVVAGADPPKLTIEAATKFVPLIVSVKAALPATVLFGEIVVIVGVREGVGLTVEAVPPPHPARNKRLTVPPSTSFLTITALPPKIMFLFLPDNHSVLPLAMSLTGSPTASTSRDLAWCISPPPRL